LAAGGAGLRAGALALILAAACLGAGDLRAGTDFATLPLAEALFLAVMFLAAAAEPDFVFDLGALRAGAFSDNDRLTSSLGRTVLPANARFFAEDAVEF
jgi:hypothetical protein